MIRDKETLRTELRDAMRNTGALDLWTGLSAEAMAKDTGDGADALIALYSVLPPLSDAAMRALLSLERMGMEPATRDLDAACRLSEQKDPGERVEWVLELAKLRGVACAVDPFDNGSSELLVKLQKGELSDKLAPVLTVETLQRALMRDMPVCGPDGEIQRDRNGAHLSQIAELLAQWAKATRARMVRAAWPGAGLEQDMLMRYALLPLCEESGLPLALELSNREAELEKQLDWVMGVLRSSPKPRFVLAARTAKAAEALLARWARPMGDRIFPVLATGKCLAQEAIGAAGTMALPFASGAGLLEQTIGDWVEARREISQALYDRYLPLVKMGWGVEREEIDADAANLLGGNWERFSAYA